MEKENKRMRLKTTSWLALAIAILKVVQQEMKD